MKILNASVYKVTQYFGESPELYKKYGYKGHTGLDLGAKYGSVLCEYSGVVVFTGAKGDYGQVIMVRIDSGVIIRYAHLSKILVGLGQNVIRGEFIAISGNTGYSTGPHLHLQVDAGPSNNGYGGAVDPIEFFKNISEDIMDADFVTILYRGLLGREPDTGGLAYFQKLSPQAAYKEIYNSAEAIRYRSLLSEYQNTAEYASQQLRETQKILEQYQASSTKEKKELQSIIESKTQEVSVLNDNLIASKEQLKLCQLSPPPITDSQISEIINKIVDAVKNIFKKGK